MASAPEIRGSFTLDGYGDATDENVIRARQRSVTLLDVFDAELNSFTDICQSFLHRLALRIAAFKGGTGHDVAA